MSKDNILLPSSEENLTITLSGKTIHWQDSEGDVVLTLHGPWLHAIGGNMIQAYEVVFEEFGEKLHQALIAVNQLRVDTAARLKAERGGQ